MLNFHLGVNVIVNVNNTHNLFKKNRWIGLWESTTEEILWIIKQFIHIYILLINKILT